MLAYFVNLGLSSRQTRSALLGFHGIQIFHQTVINYVNAAAAYISNFVDENCPVPESVVAGDETYITVENRDQYTWFSIDSVSKAICGFNLSGKRDTQPCYSLLQNTFGKPDKESDEQFEYVADGLGSYDSAVTQYNKHAERECIVRHTVTGLENLNAESKEYRPFKQIIERLNRTYKYHTRPRAGFKTFDGAVGLTVLFVAFYNFMRPHSERNGPPFPLECLKGIKLYPRMWNALLKQAA